MSVRPQKPGGGVPRGGEPPPSISEKSQELLDAINALAYGVTTLSESLPRMIEALEVVSQQFAVIIAAEAQRRNTSAENLVQNMLMNLGQRVFKPRR